MSEVDLFLKLKRMFDIDKEFDKAMIYFIKNSTKQFL